jgi:hypothetical protein
MAPRANWKGFCGTVARVAFFLATSESENVSHQSNQQKIRWQQGLNDAARLRFLNKREPLTRL